MDRKVIASHVDGRELNSPNDIVVASDGTMYFTDPPWGRQRGDVGLIRERMTDGQRAASGKFVFGDRAGICRR